MNNFQKTLSKYGVYFEDLRRRFFLLFKIFAGVFLLGFFATSPFIKLFIKHLAIKDVLIVATSPFQLVNLAMSAGFFLACVIVTPFFIYHLYAFLRPGLLPRERKSFVSLIPLALVLFFVGFSYGFAMLYFAVQGIAHLNVTLGVVNYWDIGRFVSELVLTSSLLGVIFEFPIVITFLVRIGVMNTQFLRAKRKHAAVGIFILVSLLPPTDGLSLILMATPMVLIYELTIMVNSRIERQRSRNLIIK